MNIDKNKIFRNLELDITRRCNWKCPGCNRLCDIIKNNNSDLNLNDIKNIVLELNNSNLYFNRINIMGGEPTLNPECYEICKYIKENLKIRVVALITNFTNIDVINKIQNLDIIIPEWDNSINISEIKKNKIIKHASFLISPKEKNMQQRESCYISETFGFSIFKYKGDIKYFICPPGSSLCHLLNKDELLFNSLDELLNCDISNIIENICSNCMFSSKKFIYVRNNKNEISKCFENGLDKLKKED